MISLIYPFLMRIFLMAWAVLVAFVSGVEVAVSGVDEDVTVACVDEASIDGVDVAMVV